MIKFSIHVAVSQQSVLRDGRRNDEEEEKRKRNQRGKQQTKSKEENTATLQPERLHTNYIFFLDIHGYTSLLHE
jgi:hypothetical protein